MKKRICIITLLIWFLSIGSAGADDTEIFGSPPVEIEPNVLIIFDTSGSMGATDIPSNPYVPATDYTADSAGYTKDAIYRWSTATNNWVQFVSGTSALDATTCDEAIGELNTNGLTFVTVNNSSPYDCSDKDPDDLPAGYAYYDLRMGNQLNYETGGYKGPMSSRTNVAKQVVNNLIVDFPNVRYGVMRFNGYDGGRLIPNGEIQDWSTARAAQLQAAVNALPASGVTPLAETLAEAGLYFAGANAYFDSSNYTTYTSPIDVKCRPNYIILMTDGDANNDTDRILHTNTYLLGEVIGDEDGDGEDRLICNRRGCYYPSLFLDDVAHFLFNHDLRPNLGAEDDFETQNIVTHTIGFRNSHPLLRDTAENGGGLFFTASSAQSLAMAFNTIMGTIETGTQTFVTPSVPVSRTNRVYAGNSLYIGLFKPDMSTSNWRGNLKKYTLSTNFDTLLDADGNVATDANGYFADTSRSYWSSSADGNDVDAGGAGSILVNNASRNLYTYLTGTGADPELTATRNSFSIGNTDLTTALLAADNDTHRDNIIKDIHGFNPDGTNKAWPMADVLHSEPQVVAYDTDGDSVIDNSDGSVIYVSTNGGVMHAFLDSGTTIEELWGFVPTAQLDRLKLLSQNSVKHNYFLDGPPAVFDVGTNKYLAFGERRGGRNYYVLDITSHTEPRWQYQIDEDILGGAGAEQLGQSWGRPQLVKIATGTTTSQEVLLLPGGYDTNQDNETITTNDTRGRGIFTVTATGGALFGGFYNDATTGANSDMQYSIVDVIGVDTSGNGLINSAYAPDLGGNMFAFTDGDHDGSWDKYRLFDASTGTTLSTRRKIFYAPDIIRIEGDPDPTDSNNIRVPGEMIFFGTGDRADPQETDVVNRFYAVKNYWWPTGFTTMTESNLHDATNNYIVQGDATQKATAETELKERMGWFIELEQPGEKVVGSPVVFNGVVYFTTYAPPASGGSSQSDCDSTDVGSGNARLYGLSYKDGRAVHDDWSLKKEYDPETGEEIESGGKADRWKNIGYFIPSPPVILVHKGVARMYVGADGKLLVDDPIASVEMNMYYWRDSQP